MAAEDYPAIDQGKGKRPLRDYTEYSQLLACLYWDVRKEFSAPNMPFVTLFLVDFVMSNAGFHYHGSAKFFAQAGKAFAEALLKESSIQ